MKKRLVLTLLVLVGICWNVSAQRGSDSVSGALEISNASGEVVASFTNAHALVIGEIKYTDPAWGIPLTGVKEDVVAVRKLFEEQGFNVVTLEDKKSLDLKNGITNFLDTYAYNRDARIIVYFAGHGATVDLGGRRMGYIVPIDAPVASNNSNFLQVAIPMTQFETWAKQYTSRHILFIFDSCFSGSVFRSRGSVPPAINRLINLDVRQFITSGDADEEVPDESIFRRELENALRNAAADSNGDGYVTGKELGIFLYERVSKLRNGKQNPREGKLNDVNLDKGDFIFVVSSGGSSGVVTNPRQEQTEKQPVLITIPEKGTDEFFIGTWVATTEYNNSFDTYEVNLSINNRRKVAKVKIINDDAEQEATGTWSWDGSIFKLNVVFRRPAIAYQRNIDWVTQVGFTNDENVFHIFGKASTNGPTVRLTLNRE